MKRNKYNPHGLHLDAKGVLRDKHGREMHIDTAEFARRRMKDPRSNPTWPKVINPMSATVAPVPFDDSKPFPGWRP